MIRGMLNEHLLIHLNVNIMNVDVPRLLACHNEFSIMMFYCITLEVAFCLLHRLELH